MVSSQLFSHQLYQQQCNDSSLSTDPAVQMLFNTHSYALASQRGQLEASQLHLAQSQVELETERVRLAQLQTKLKLQEGGARWGQRNVAYDESSDESDFDDDEDLVPSENPKRIRRIRRVVAGQLSLLANAASAHAGDPHDARLDGGTAATGLGLPATPVGGLPAATGLGLPAAPVGDLPAAPVGDLPAAPVGDLEKKRRRGEEEMRNTRSRKP